jgi:serine/threonine-protein kinase
VAIILWECLAGTRLFRAENQAATLNKICIEPIPMPSSVDAALAPFDAILAKGLARDPSERFQTAEEFAEAIEQNAETLGGIANQRTVAKLVRDYAAEKIDHDRELIRGAIAELGTNPEYEAAPAPEAPVYSRSPVPTRQQSFVAAPPIEIPEPALTVRKRVLPMMLLGVLVIIVVGVAATFLIRRPQAPTVTSSPLAPSATDAPTPAAPTPPPAPPAAAVVPNVQPPSSTVPDPAVETARRSESAQAPSGKRTQNSTSTSSAPGVAPPKPRKTKPAQQQDLLLNPYRTQN